MKMNIGKEHFTQQIKRKSQIITNQLWTYCIKENN